MGKGTTVRTYAATILVATLASHEARAHSKEACFAAHESSQIARRDGRLRLAREQLAICSDESCPRIVREVCAGWIEELKASTPTIVLEARGVGNANVRVSLDGQPLTERLDGRAVALDPGEHRFRFETSTGASRELQILVPEGRKNVPVVADFAERRAPETRKEVDPTRRTLGFVVLGVGAASLAAGAVSGVLAISAANDVVCRSPCRATTSTGAPNPDLVNGNNAYDRSQTLAWITDIALGAGILAAGIGTFLVLTARAPKSKASLVPAFVAQGGALVLQGPL